MLLLRKGGIEIVMMRKRIVLGLGFTIVVVSHLRAAMPTAELSPARVAFEQIKTLAGEWRTSPGDNQMINIFRPIAFGTAVLHEEWKDGEQLTATVFYMVGDELRADHFCDFENQLHFVVKASSDKNALEFELKDATNLDAHPRHFHAATWRLADDGHLLQDWRIIGGDAAPASPHLDFTRHHTEPRR